VPTDVEMIEALRPVEDPELHRSIVDLGMVKGAVIEGTNARITIALTTPGCPLKNEINSRVRGAISALDGVDEVEVEFTAMNPQELAALRQSLHGDPAATAGSQPAHGHAEGRIIPFADPGS